MSDLDEWYQRWPSLFVVGAWYQLPNGVQVLAKPFFKPDDKTWPAKWDLYPIGTAKPAFSVIWGTIPPTVFRRDDRGRLSWSELSLEDISLVKVQP